MKKSILSISIILILSGCAVIPDIEKNRVATAKNKNEIKSFSLSTNTIKVQTVWAKIIEDEEIRKLLVQVKNNNTDLKIIKLNLEKAQEYSSVIGSNNYPTINFGSSFNREKLSATGMTPPPYAGSIINMGQIGLNSRYTIDYMNKSGLLLQEQSKKIDGYQNQLENIELAIQVQVVKSYLYYQYLLEQENFINEKLDIYNELILSYKNGLVLGKTTENDLNEIINQSIYFKNSLNINKQNKESVINMLIQLSGNNEVNISRNEEIWKMTKVMPLEKLDILIVRERPDIKYYFTNIEAQRSKLEALKSDFYPSISLTGNVGFQKVGFNDLFNKNSIFWNFGPEISLPIFDSGKIKSNYKIAGIDLNIFIENYNNAMFSAIQEINNNLIKEKIYYGNLENQNEIYSNKLKNFNNNKNLFELGKISKIAKLKNDLELINAKEQKLNDELNYFSAKLDLTQSIGGK